MLDRPRRYALLAVAALSMAAIFLLFDVSDYWTRFSKFFFLVNRRCHRSMTRAPP